MLRLPRWRPLQRSRRLRLRWSRRLSMRVLCARRRWLRGRRGCCAARVRWWRRLPLRRGPRMVRWRLRRLGGAGLLNGSACGGCGWLTAILDAGSAHHGRSRARWPLHARAHRHARRHGRRRHVINLSAVHALLGSSHSLCRVALDALLLCMLLDCGTAALDRSNDRTTLRRALRRRRPRPRRRLEVASSRGRQVEQLWCRPRVWQRGRGRRAFLKR